METKNNIDEQNTYSNVDSLNSSISSVNDIYHPPYPSLNIDEPINQLTDIQNTNLPNSDNDIVDVSNNIDIIHKLNEMGDIGMAVKVLISVIVFVFGFYILLTQWIVRLTLISWTLIKYNRIPWKFAFPYIKLTLPIWQKKILFNTLICMIGFVFSSMGGNINYIFCGILWSFIIFRYHTNMISFCNKKFYQLTIDDMKNY